MITINISISYYYSNNFDVIEYLVLPSRQVYNHFINYILHINVVLYLVTIWHITVNFIYL